MLPASGCPTDFTPITTNANGWTGLNATSGTAYVNSTTGNQLGRVDIAVAPSNSNYVYAQVQSIAPNSNGGCGGANGCQLGAYRTTDGGITWTQIAGSPGASLANCSGSSGRVFVTSAVKIAFIARTWRSSRPVCSNSDSGKARLGAAADQPGAGSAGRAYGI